MLTPADVIAFWVEAGPDAWFRKDAGFDLLCRSQFEEAHHRAARREYDKWAGSPEGALALLLLLDQMPRNMFRGSAHAFATDGLAQEHALAALVAGHDLKTEMPLRIFFYLPLEHAENLDLQARCLALFENTGVDEYVKYARVHYDIIARFGRFPHRNAVLGRMSTEEELAFLEGGGFSG